MSLVEHSLSGDRYSQGRLIEQSILCRETDIVKLGWATSLVKHFLLRDRNGPSELGCEFSGA